MAAIALQFTIVMLGYPVIFGILYLVFGKAGVFLGLIGAILWFAVLIKLFGTFLAAMLNSGSYRSARNAVTSGNIAPEYAIRSSSCGGIALVDPANRRIYINGGIFGFDEIRNVRWESGGNGTFMEFQIAHGANPLRRVILDSQNACELALARLSNDLGLV